MVIGLLEEAEQRERRLRQLQHWVEQLLRARYGPRRERVNENQLFLFAVALVSAGREAPPEPASSGGRENADRRRRRQARRDMAGERCRNRWSGGGWSTISRKRSGSVRNARKS